MRIGITYDLRDDYLARGFDHEETAEFDRAETIDAIYDAISRLGHTPIRIGSVMDLVPRLASGERWDLVFNIAEGLYGLGREALVPALLDAYRIPYVFSDPLVMAVTLHKGIAKTILRGMGIPTPDFAVVESLGRIPEIRIPLPLFVKPVAEGTGKGITPASKIEDYAALEKACADILNRYRQPALVERYMPGREFTVGIIGTGDKAQAIGAMEVIVKESDDVYSYHRKEHWETLVSYELAKDREAEDCIAVALKAWRGLGCRDGGRVDLKMDENHTPHFLEVNPLPGLHPTHSDLPILAGLCGMDFQELIKRILESSMRRMESAE